MSVNREVTQQLRELGTCYGFARHVLGLPLYDGAQAAPAEPVRCTLADGTVVYEVDARTDWQKRVLDAIDSNGSRVSLRTANGSGKTSMILVATILWHMTMFPRSTVISTAGVDRQVRAQLYPHLRRFAPQCRGFVFHDGALTIETPKGARYIGFTTDNPGRAEGWHGKDVETLRDIAGAVDGPLMIIVDEAKSIPKLIFEAFDRCTYQRLLYTSSPGISDGDFYDSQTKSGSPFKRFVVPASMCPHADHRKNAEVIAKRGIEHPLVRSAIFAEFQTNEKDYVMTVTDIERCENAPPKNDPTGGRRAYCDFAAGGDENVFALREGNRARIVRAWRDVNTMAACADFIRLFRENGFEPANADEIGADADGLGAPMLDRLAELGWHLCRERNGSASDDPEAYANRGAETWFEGAERIKRREVILADLDEETRAQMCGRRRKPNSSGKLALESKEEMRRRGVTSPDRADALLGCLRRSQTLAARNFMGGGAITGSRLAAARDEVADSHDDGRDYSLIGGADCG
ncbi:MAG: hypothetical protein RL077_349 [Verrucomicrobiota bacterium]|jgi:hypothetical protein